MNSKCTYCDGEMHYVNGTVTMVHHLGGKDPNTYKDTYVCEICGRLSYEEGAVDPEHPKWHRG